MRQFVQRVVNAGVRVLLYYGDTDGICNFLLGQKFADQLGFKRIANKTGWNFGGQVAGYKTLYEKGLTFTTVLGAGHMVPKLRPAQAQYMIHQFLGNKAL